MARLRSTYDTEVGDVHASSDAAIPSSMTIHAKLGVVYFLFTVMIVISTSPKKSRASVDTRAGHLFTFTV